MTHSPNGIQREIKVKGQKLRTVTSFKLIRRDNISLGSNVKLVHSLVISICLYALGGGGGG